MFAQNFLSPKYSFEIVKEPLCFNVMVTAPSVSPPNKISQLNSTNLH